MADEKSAIDIILQLPSILKKIENKIDVLDTNLKILNSKLNKMKETGSSTIEQPKEELKKDIINIDKKITSPQDGEGLPRATPGPNYNHDGLPNLKQTPKLVIGGIKVFSTVKTSSGKSVENMTINIFDSQNDLIRNLVTDKDGYWECRLPSGAYSMEMIHPKLKTINKTFSITKDVKSYEVT